MQSCGDFPNGSSEPVDGDDHKVVTFAEPAHAFRPAGSVATGASGRGVGEDPVGGDAGRRDGVVLLIDGLLPGGHPEDSAVTADLFRFDGLTLKTYLSGTENAVGVAKPVQRRPRGKKKSFDL